MPDRWRGLILDQSTFDNAVGVLGKPAKDKIGSVSAQEIDNWLTKKRKEKIFRNVQFDKPQGMKKVFLSFLDDKLVMISLQLKNSISPEALSNIYGVPFEPKIGAMNIALILAISSTIKERLILRPIQPCTQWLLYLNVALLLQWLLMCRVSWGHSVNRLAYLINPAAFRAKLNSSP